MEKDFKELMSETKGLLKDLLKSDSSKEEIERITNIDKSLDSLSEAHGKQETELKEFKELVVNQVKNTGFKGTDKDVRGDDEIPDVDSAIESSINDILAKRK